MRRPPEVMAWTYGVLTAYLRRTPYAESLVQNRAYGVKAFKALT